LLAKDGIEECSTYLSALQNSWLWQDLHRARNIRPAMRWGLLPGLAYAAIDTYIFRGKAPWTLSNHADHTSLKKAAEVSPLSYPAYDQRLSFDRSSSVYLANLDQPEDQPCHLKLKDPALALSLNLPVYASPETRYCPAGVYEILNHEALPQFQISAANCVHCKACDIKDPTQNIVWTPPEGGSGPRYEEM
jgi:electron-transferring-flavoprotein dehydrogenase